MRCLRHGMLLPLDNEDRRLWTGILDLERKRQTCQTSTQYNYLILIGFDGSPVCVIAHNLFSSLSTLIRARGCAFFSCYQGFSKACLRSPVMAPLPLRSALSSTAR